MRALFYSTILESFSTSITCFLLLLTCALIGILIHKNKNYERRILKILEEEACKRNKLEIELGKYKGEAKALVADNNMRLLFKKQLLEQLREDHNVSHSSEVKDYAKGLLLKIKLQIATENKLSSLQKKGYSLHTEFQSKIVELYPDITKTEREVCSLLRLNLSIKEVASIRNTTIGSVKTIRHRIRKKMEVPEGEILEHFVQSL